MRDIKEVRGLNHEGPRPNGYLGRRGTVQENFLLPVAEEERCFSLHRNEVCEVDARVAPCRVLSKSPVG
ncbi:hypothetical protein DPMN_159870 [Dreissena polymorpha]|uniref:Uncharacterized protein n=1 Tax=Dreissena polymorpha TaxID=45954 RepID=A0A9D4ELB9_DREPO|nr:hypothetical protein DPMN_159870 [Dreissena polymorpha]